MTELTPNTWIEIFGQHKSDRKFIEDTKNFKFPKIKKLKFQRIDCLTGFEMLEATNKFMANAIEYPLKYLKLSCWEHQFDLNKFIDGLSQILQLVQKQIYISNWVLDEDVFETILEVSNGSNQL